LVAVSRGPAVSDDRALLTDIFAAALAAVDPTLVLAKQLQISNQGACLRQRSGETLLPLLTPGAGGALRLIAIGKAAGPFARAFCAEVAVDAGIVIAPLDAPAQVAGLEDIAADHPDAAAASRAAADRLLQFIDAGRADDRYAVLLTGGASALCALPIAGISDGDKRQAVLAMMNAGASIAELNALRKHLSQLKGGRLAARLAPAPIVTLAISDVPDDDPAVIGSGPTVADPSTFADVQESIRRYGIESELPPAVLRHLSAGLAGQVEETPKAQDLAPQPYIVIASLDDALEAARLRAQAQGFQVVSLGRSLYGEVADEARRLARAVAQLQGDLQTDTQPGLSLAERGVLLMAGGEPSLRLVQSSAQQPGVGGRAQHLALLLARELADRSGVTVLVAGTDGIDGRSPAAGGFADASTWKKIIAAGIDPEAALVAANSHTALGAAGDVFTTGRTMTNVADLVLISIRAS